MDRRIALGPITLALLLVAGSPSLAQVERLHAEAVAAVSVQPSTWTEEFRSEWLARERALEEEYRKAGLEAEKEFAEETASLREDLREDEEELREEFAKDLEDLREELKDKRAAILSSGDDAEEKQSDLNDLDDDFYDDRDKLEAEHRGESSDLRRAFDDKVAELARERDQKIRKAARDSRAAIEGIAAKRKEALLRRDLDLLRLEALSQILSLRGVNPFGEPVIAGELAERLGSRAVFSEEIDESGGLSHVILSVKVEVDPEQLATVMGQWGLLVPPAPIVIRFSRWNGDVRRAEAVLRASGYLDPEHVATIEGTDVVVTGKSYLPAERVIERLNRISIGGGEVRSVSEGTGLRVTPFP